MNIGLTQHKTFLKDILRFLAMNNMIKIGFGGIIVLVIMSLLEPLINMMMLGGHQSTDVLVFPPNLEPSLQHPLGTDFFGRDIFALIITGTRNSLIIGAVTGIIVTFVATAIALIAGYKGGVCDHLLRSITDTVLVIPTLPFLIVLTLYVESVDIFTMCLLLAAFSWPWTARSIRAQVLSLREMNYVELAKMSGESDLEIIFKEIFPNLMPYIGVGFARAVISAIFAETGIRIIGLGPGNIITLGLLINWGMTYSSIYTRWWITLTPVIVLIFLFVSLNLINTGLDEAYNPRLKKVTGQ